MKVEASMSAGVGCVDITPPLPIDIVGSAYRWRPAEKIHSPLQAYALVLRQDATTLAILTVDLLGVQDPASSQIRRRVSEVLETEPSHVLLNASHTHAGPPSYRGVKIGGNQRSFSELEELYIDLLSWKIETAVRLAVQQLEPVRVAYGRGSVDWGVNRRERTPDGQTILGWNPEGPCDREVAVLRFDDLEGRTRAFLVNYACHPVVYEERTTCNVSSDFVGPLREFVFRVSGAKCLFLQGAAGNIDPLECCLEYPGPEVPFGERIALEALHAVADARSAATEIVRAEDLLASAATMALYRRRPAGQQPRQPLAAAVETVSLPLLPLPSVEEVRRTVDKLQQEYMHAKRGSSDQVALNRIDYHLLAAERTLRELETGKPRTAVDAEIQALRIGDSAIAAVPGEPFSEISLNVKSASPAALTMFAGCTNGLVSYIPSAAEYAFGGYECLFANRGFGLPSQIGPNAEGIVTSSCIRLLKKLFEMEESASRDMANSNKHKDRKRI